VEEKLSQQLRLTESISTHAGEGLFLLDDEGRVTFMNPAAERMFGWKKEELIGGGLHEVIHHQHAKGSPGSPVPTSHRLLGPVLKSGKDVKGHEDVFYTKAGNAIAVRCSSAPVMENGRVTGAVLVVADITEKKAAEEQLRRSYETFYHLIQNSPFGIYVVDADFRVAEVSQGAQKVFSNVRPLLGRDFAEVMRIVWEEPFATEAIERFQHTLKTGEPYTATRTVEKRHDISEIEAYDWRIERISLPNGRFGVVCYFYDWTERQRWSAALRLSEERFQLAVRATNDAIWDWNIGSKELWWNEGIQSLFGYGQDTVEPLITWWEERIHPDDRERVVDQIGHVIRGTSTAWHAEYRFRRADGGYADVLDRGYVMRDAHGNAIRMLGAMQDLTERKKSEAALAAAQKELKKHAGRLEELVEERTATLRDTIAELETLSYSISHDMRAPLRAMQGFSQALLEDHVDELKPEGASHLLRISAAARRLDSLIQDILLYTSVAREPLVLKEVPLETLLPEVIQTYHPDQESRIHLQRPLPTVLGHEAFLSQIFSNLITNALKFVPPGEIPFVEIRSEEAGEMVKITVSDRGIGIAPQHLKAIFQVFGRVYSQSEYPGTGIGLAIVKRAVQRLGGDVGVDSELEKGSRFWLTLRRV
jgi:PAS domain S-box-containing protein